jgi:cell division protein FtsW (lipid II flippase)
VILFSASDQNLHIFKHQLIHVLLAFSLLILLAQTPPETYLKWAPMLLMAEEYKAGTLKPQEPDCKDL